MRKIKNKTMNVSETPKEAQSAVRIPKDVITNIIRKEMDKCDAFYNTYTFVRTYNLEEGVIPTLVLENEVKHIESYKEGCQITEWKLFSEDKYLFLKLIFLSGKQLNFYFNLDEIFDRIWLQHVIVHRNIILSDAVRFGNNSFIIGFQNLPLNGLMKELIKSKYCPLIINNLDELKRFFRIMKEKINSEMIKGDLSKQEHFPYIY